MKLLLDTHAYLWLLTTPRKVGKKARNLVQAGEHEVLLSVISLTEIAIKANKRKINFDFTLVEETLNSIGATLLDLKLPHIGRLNGLEVIHNDPFDRLLIAQAKSEEATLITNDDNIQKYAVSWVWS